MTATKVVEVRLTIDPHSLKQDQALQLIRVSPGHDIAVGLGFGGCAAAVALDVPEPVAADLGRQIAEKARDLGLEVTLVEVLDPAEYEARALAEDVDD